MAVMRSTCNTESKCKIVYCIERNCFRRDLAMKNHLSTYQRERIASLSEEGISVSQIASILESEGRRTSRATVRKWVNRWETNRGLHDQHRSGRPSKVTPEIAAFMEAKMEEDDEITSAELHRLIARHFSANISAPTLRRYIRQKLEWVAVRTRFGPMISERNKLKRQEFAQMCLDEEDIFDNVIWSDESSVQLTRHAQTMRVKIGRERVLKPQAKQALKVHIWAAISRTGATRICVFDQNMDGPLYVSILEEFLLPFLIEKFPDGQYRFMQGNDPKHTSRVAKDFYAQKSINWWKTPASSADFKPIEWVWRKLKHFIARVVKPLSKKELMEGILLFWRQRMTPEKCCTYINHTFKVLPLIVAKEGGITGE